MQYTVLVENVNSDSLFPKHVKRWKSLFMPNMSKNRKETE